MPDVSSKLQLLLTTSMALFAFAGNSILCRLALAQNSIDPGSFTLIRLYSGTLTLVAIVLLSKGMKRLPTAGSWSAGFCLLVYAAGFSFAYIQLPTGTGALILFTCVQLTMITISWFKNQRLTPLQWTDTIISFSGFVYLLTPSVSAPPIVPSLLMASAGIAWGVYSILGGQSTFPTADTASNFFRASILTIVALPFIAFQNLITAEGVWLAILSGSITSGIGYAIWYKVLPSISGNVASVSQLTVPIIAALGGLIMLNEQLSLRFVSSAALVLSGILLVIYCRDSNR